MMTNRVCRSLSAARNREEPSREVSAASRVDRNPLSVRVQLDAQGVKLHFAKPRAAAGTPAARSSSRDGGWSSTPGWQLLRDAQQ
jgi:hypothetical protein